MALSKQSVEKAYVVFNELRNSVLPELRILSFPADILEVDSFEKEFPHLNKVYGWDRKSDGGWENLIFFLVDPAEIVKAKFKELSEKVPNTAISKPYARNNKIWIMGWI